MANIKPSEEDTKNLSSNNNIEQKDKLGLTKEERKKWTRQTAGLISTLANCMAGSVVLTLPSVFANTGFIMACIYMAISLSYSMWSYKVMINACYYTNSISIYQLALRCYGKGFAVLCDVALTCAYVGFLCSYISVAADYVHQGISDIAKFVNPDKPILQEDMWPKLFRVILGYVIMFPLTMLRSLKSLNSVSSFSILFFLVAACSVIYYFSVYASEGDMKTITFLPGRTINRENPQIYVLPEAKYAPNILSYFSLFFTLYTLHANIPPILGELKGPYQARKNSLWTAALIAATFVAVFYLLVGFLGSMMFDRDCPDEKKNESLCWPLDGNILKSFVGLLPMTVIKLLYAIVIFVCYPIVLQPSRVSILGWFKAPSKFTKKGYGWFILCGFVITTISLLLSVFIPNIDDAINIFSTVFGAIIFEVLPVLVQIKVPMLKKYYERCIKDRLETPDNLNEKNNNAGAIDISYMNFNFDTSLIIPNSTRQSGTLATITNANEAVSMEQNIADVHEENNNVTNEDSNNSNVKKEKDKVEDEVNKEKSFEKKEENSDSNDSSDNISGNSSSSNNSEILPEEEKEEESASELEFVHTEDLHKKEENNYIATHIPEKNNNNNNAIINAGAAIRKASVLQRISISNNPQLRNPSITAAMRASMDRRGSFSALFIANNEEGINLNDSTNAASNSINVPPIPNENSRRSSLVTALMQADRDRAQIIMEKSIGTVEGITIDPERVPVNDEEWLEHQNNKMKIAAELNEADPEAAKELAKDPKKQDERIIKNTFIPSIGSYRGKRSRFIGLWFFTALFIFVNCISLGCQLYIMVEK